MNNDNNTIHETVIRDIVDVMTDITNSENLPGVFTNKSYKSITKASDKLTLVFPVFVSSSISIDTAVMISKAIERKCVTMMQMLFSAICITDADNTIDYISKFHGNISADELNVDEFIDIADKLGSIEESFSYNNEVNNVLRDFKGNLNTTLPESINEDSLGNYVVETTYNGEKNIYPIREARGDGLRKLLDIEERINERPPLDPRTARGMSDIAKAGKDANDIERNRVFTTDIKKANELVPTMMVINFYSADTQYTTTAVIGIKAKLYPVDSEDAIERIYTKNKDNEGFHNFIRATTREISFWKDFVFALDKAKIDALNSGRRGSKSKIWKVLERRALKGKIKRFIGLGNDAAAISTLVVSKDDVEALKKEYDIDVEKPYVIKPIMDSYSLMGFVIVDEATEVVKFLFDSDDNSFETLTFSHLEREASDNSYKKVINLMTKMTR